MPELLRPGLTLVGSVFLPGQGVLLDDTGGILAVGDVETLAVPEGTIVSDLSDRALMAGLVDAQMCSARRLRALGRTAEDRLGDAGLAARLAFAESLLRGVTAVCDHVAGDAASEALERAIVEAAHLTGIRLTLVVGSPGSGAPEASADTETRRRHPPVEAGRRADLLTLDLTHPATLPHADLVANLSRALTSAAVRDVCVDGRWVVRDGTLLTVSTRRLSRAVAEWSAARAAACEA